MAIQEEAELILKLYDLRREDKMRQARDWYFRVFNPESAQEVMDTMFGEHGAHVRMVLSYWDMAASLVNRGAIGTEFFNEANGEHFSVFAKMEPILEPTRAMMGPVLANLEKLIDATPGGRERCANIRERMKEMRARFAAERAKTA